MKLALLNPESYFGDPPLGLGYIASYLEKYAKVPVELRIFDKVNLVRELKKFDPDLVGCNAVSETFFNANKLAREIKDAGVKAPLFIGGLHLSLHPSDFKQCDFDIAVLGEAERTVLEVVEEFEEVKKLKRGVLEKIDGLMFRDSKTGEVIKTKERELIQNLDEVPFPDRELLNMSFYLQPRPGTKNNLQVRGAMMTSRGCPYRCGFCATTVFWKNKIRYHSPEYVAKEAKLLAEKYGIEHIFIFDDLFMVDRKRVKGIVQALEKEGIRGKVEFSMQARANLVDEEMARDLKEMGVTQLIFGFESGSDRILKKIKGPTVSAEVNRRAVEYCKKYGIDAQGLFIIGSPEETVEDLQKTYDFIKTAGLQYAMIYQGYPFVGTEWWRYAVAQGIIEEEYYSKPHDRLWLGHDYEKLLTKNIPVGEFKEWVRKFDELQKTFEPNVRVNFWRYRNLKYFFRYEFLKRYVRSYASRFITNHRVRIEKAKNVVKRFVPGAERETLVLPTAKD